MEKYAFIYDTNNNLIFYAKFYIDVVINDRIQNWTYKILYIHQGTPFEIENWFRWSLPENLKMGDMYWFEDIPIGYMRKAIRFLFTEKL